MSEKSSPDKGLAWQQAFVERRALPSSYRAYAQKWFDPLVDQLLLHHKSAAAPLLVGISGSQGSGKSTLADYLVAALGAEHDLQAVTLSLDDVYLPRAQRAELADQVHPLFATRGVPGTHDLPLLLATLDGLRAGLPLALPRFDKSVDDRQPEHRWPVVRSQPAIVILEGWCLGAAPQSDAELRAPLNELESQEDADGRWRDFVNRALGDFSQLYERIDYWVMLKAPSFACVLDWRSQQEAKLAAARPGAAGLMGRRQLERFVQHFQRLTENCLEQLPARVDCLYQLDEERDIRSSSLTAGEGGSP